MTAEQRSVWRRLVTPGVWRRLVPAVVAATIAGTGAVVWLRTELDQSARGGERVIIASTLGQSEPRIRSSAIRFERIRIPANATDVQLSLPIPLPARDERFAADIVAVDGGIVTRPAAVVVAVSATTAVVNVTTPAPRDGDYLLRLRRLSGDTEEIVLTTGFRVVRVTGGMEPTR